MDIRRDQAIMFAKRLFGHKYAVEMRLPKGPKIFSVGRSASYSGLRPERRSHSVDRKETCWSYHRKLLWFQACDFLPQTCRGEREKLPTLVYVR